MLFQLSYFWCGYVSHYLEALSACSAVKMGWGSGPDKSFFWKTHFLKAVNVAAFRNGNEMAWKRYHVNFALSLQNFFCYFQQFLKKRMLWYTQISGLKLWRRWRRQPKRAWTRLHSRANDKWKTRFFQSKRAIFKSPKIGTFWLWNL